MKYDLVIVGGGTAGLVGAQIAAGMGARVALVERERTGGDCLWTGCVPSKSLIAAAALAHRMRHAASVGLAAVEPDIDFSAVMGHVREAQRTIAPHDSPERLRAAGVEVIHGDGAFDGERTLRAGGRRLEFRRALIATGSRPQMPPVESLEEAGPLTTETVWELQALPEALLVLGGGPVGCELAQAFARLGSRVVVVERDARLLGKEEPSASARVQASLQRDGIDVRTSTSLEAVVRGDGYWTAQLSDRSSVRVQQVLVASGRRPNTETLNLAAAGVETGDGGAVRTDARLRTTSSAVYAAGDVTGRLPFTHVAAHHARIAIPNALLGLRRTADQRAIPWVTFTDPEIARVGLTHDQAVSRWGSSAQVADFDLRDLDRAITAGSTDGFARLVGDHRRRLVGATVAGPGAGEAIAEMAAWIRQGERIDAISQSVHAYPTFGEGPARAADDHIRARLLDGRTRLLLRPALAGLRLLAR